MSEILVYIQNEKNEMVKEPSPLAYTTSISDAWSAEFDLSKGMDELVEQFVKEVVATLKVVIANDANPTQDWHVIYVHGGTPYYRVDLLDAGIRMSASVNSGVSKVPEADAFCSSTRDELYDWMFDLFGPSLLKTTLSSALGAASKAMGGSSASFKSTDDVDAIVQKIQEDTKAEIVKPKENMSDYVCDDTLKEQLLQIVDFFDNRTKYVDAGIEIPKGVLFKGPPGTGKTYAARCIAGTVDCYFMICTASSLQGMYIGSGAANIKAVFKGARLLAEKSGKGVIVFIDELDSVGARSSNTSGAGDEVNRTINQLLAEMSGFNDDENIMVMGATNFSDVIDPALLRSGRFSRQITIDYPDDTQREQMLKHYVGKLKLTIGWDSAEASALTKTFTPADIKEVVNSAAIKCVRHGKSAVSLDDLNEAINEVITKDIRKPDDPKTLGLVTAHECGHVLMEVLLKHRVPTKVTNYAYGDAGGFTQPSEILTGIVKRTDIINEVRMLLGGRAAEEVVMKYVTTGASNDLDKAKKLLKSYFERYNFEHYDSEKLNQLVLDRLSGLYESTLQDLKDNEKYLHDLIDALASKRVLYSADIASLVAPLLMKGGSI